MSRKYWNGFSIVSLVFFIITLLPLGIVGGIGAGTAEYDITQVSLDINGTRVIYISEGETHFINYEVYSNQKIDVYLLSKDQFAAWNETGIPTAYIKNYYAEEQFFFFNGNKGYGIIDHPHMEDEGDENATYTTTHDQGGPQYVLANYLVLINTSDNSVQMDFVHIGINTGLLIASVVLGIINATFLTFLILHTLFFILASIFGSGSKKEDQSEYQKSKVYMSYNQSQGSEREKTYEAAPKHEQKKKFDTPEDVSVVVQQKKGQIVYESSGNVVKAKEPKDYGEIHQLKGRIEKLWDYAGVAEKILIGIAVFWVLIGVTTFNWWMLLAFAAPLVLIAYIVGAVREHNRNRIISLIEGHGAIDVLTLEKYIEASANNIRNHIWDIIRLGLANVAYDVSNDVVFIPGQVSVKTREKKENYEKGPQHVIEDQQQQKTEKTVDEKIIYCPFCDAENPADSKFCIKCGASLHPAK